MTSLPTAGQPGQTRHRIRRRIELLLPSLNPGGAQQSYLTLSRLLSDYHDARLVVVNTSGPLRHEIPRDVELVDLQRTGVSHALPALVRHLRHAQPAVLLSSIDHTNLLAVAAAKLARSGVTVIPRVANTLSQSQSQSQLTASNVAIRLGTRMLYPRLPGIIVPAEGVASDLVRLGVPEAAVRIVPNPVVGPSLMAAAGQPVQHPWFQSGARREVPVVVAMGRLVPQKDFGVLIEAWARVRARRRARLLILGEGPLRAALTRQAARIGVEGDIDMPGYLGNPAPYLSGADLFVLSSRWEGLPGALIQALACGTPVVATDCESGPREILDGGRFGRLVPVGDVDALAAAIEKSLIDPIPPVPEAWRPYSEEMALTAYLNLIEEFSPEVLR